jgi:metal-dependent amidase/aminoacylase/carboxypeptidase family protein
MKNHNIPGRACLLEIPAEEGGGGKLKLIDAGAFQDVHACLMTHPFSTNGMNVAYGTCMACAKYGANFTGKPAHAATAPHEGVNALDTAVLAYSGISMLRQQIKPDQRT